MTLKASELIRTGLSSELFLLAFLKPDSGYGLAQRLQNTTKTPNTGKIYPVLYSLTASKYLKNKDKQYHPNLNKLVSDIVEILRAKNVSLDDEEIHLLNNFFMRRDFFSSISANIIQKMHQQPKGIHKIDALAIFANNIGVLAASFLFYRTHNSEFIKLFKNNSISLTQINSYFAEMEDVWKQIDPQIEALFTEKLKEIPSNPQTDWIVDFVTKVFKSMPSMMVLTMAPGDTLKKLCSLWDQYEGFQLGVQLSLQNFKKESRSLNQF